MENETETGGTFGSTEIASFYNEYLTKLNNGEPFLWYYGNRHYRNRNIKIHM